MVLSATVVSLWFGAIGTFIGLISTGIAIYQWAVLNENKKRKGELQYILAGINNSALQKNMAWQNQITTLPNIDNRQNWTQQDWELARVYMRARDDFSEIVGLTTALEGTIDTNSSAITSMMDKSIETTKKNNELQSEALKNPLVEPNKQNH